MPQLTRTSRKYLNAQLFHDSSIHYLLIPMMDLLMFEKTIDMLKQNVLQIKNKKPQFNKFCI